MGLFLVSFIYYFSLYKNFEFAFIFRFSIAILILVKGVMN